MENLSAWVLSIVGIVVLSVLFDLFMSDGELSSYIKSIINFSIILVIVLPIPKLLKQDIIVGDFVYNNEIQLQEDFLYQLNNDKLLKTEKTIEGELEKLGITQIDIIISADIFDEKMQIEAVFVDLKNIVILEKDKHIDIKKEVTACVLNYIDIKKELIVFNE